MSNYYMSGSASMQNLDDMEDNNSESTQATAFLLGKCSLTRMIQNASSDETFIVHCQEDESTSSYSSNSITGIFSNKTELSIRICHEKILGSIYKLMTNCGGDLSIFYILDEPVHIIQPILQSLNFVQISIILLWAALFKKIELFPLLISRADLEVCTPYDGLTALHLSAFSGSTECIRYLLNSGAKITTVVSLSPLHCAALGNSIDCVQLLIRAGASANMPEKCYENEDAPLHSAIRANSPECMQLLLDSGANAIHRGNGGYTPLHLAVDLGYYNCYKLLLECDIDIDIDAKTENKTANTALHLAAIDERTDALQLLLDHGADATCKNSRLQTALHIAAREQFAECVEILLTKSDVNAVDDDGNTPLHVAVGRIKGSVEMVDILTHTPGIDLNKFNVHGHTPLHLAALNENPTATALLIKYGADLTAITRRDVSALGLILRKVPAALNGVKELLDSSIKISHNMNRDKDEELTLDFKPLLQGADDGIEVSFLSIFISENRSEILSHPLCQAFLYLKWQTIRKFYIARLFLTFNFVICLSLYTLLFLTNNCHNDSTWYSDVEAKHADKALEECQIDHYFGGVSKTNSVYLMMLQVVDKLFLVVAAIETIIKLYGLEVGSLAAFKKYMCQLDNILEWFVLFSVPFISNILASGEIYVWQTHLGAFSILAGWMLLMNMVGQLPYFGAYVAMYTCVLKAITKLLIAYSCLLIGFAISFCIVFRNIGVFQNPILALIKVLTMMTGELEFGFLFIESAKGNIPPTTLFEGQTFLSFSAYVFFILCLLLVTVTLMNLLVGIAVSDIQTLQAKADRYKLERQADLINTVETALKGAFANDNTFLGKLFSTKLRCDPRWSTTIMQIKPHNLFEKSLPKDIIKAAYEIAQEAKLKSQNATLFSSTSTPVPDFTSPQQQQQKVQQIETQQKSQSRLSEYLKVESQVSLSESCLKETEIDTVTALRLLSLEVTRLREIIQGNGPTEV